MSTEVPNIAGKALTVRGPIDPNKLGVTLMHEHLFFESLATLIRVPDRFMPMMEAALWDETMTLDNLHLARGRTTLRDNYLLSDEKMIVEEATEFRDHGGSTIVDVTSTGIRRDPLSLVRASIATGLNVVMGASWYVKRSYPDDMDERTVEELAEEIIRDIAVGVNDTGIRSGIIGEVGVQGEPLEPNEIKVIRASARTSRATGAPISFHWGGTGQEKSKVADVVEEEGGDLSRTIFGHSDLMAGDMPLMLELLERGVYIQFDLLGRVGVPLMWDVRSPAKPWEDFHTYSGTAIVADAILQLIEKGYAERILISHDVCTKVQLKRYGGTGYSFILESFLPRLRQMGVTEEQIRQITVENPRRALTFDAPK